MKKLLLVSLLLGSTYVYAEELTTIASHALLMDADTGTILFEKNADEKMHPASMSKLMTAYLIFEALKKGTYTLDTEFIVSDNAWQKGGAKTGGSTMFLSIGDEVRVEELLKGIIIQSGNDACIVAAENIAGDEDSFVKMMNAKAKELGLKNSTFANATGLPHPDHRMSVEDLAILAKRIIQEFPQFYHIFSQKEFVYNNIRQGNRNPLLYSMPYADGLKTGHTDEAGYCLTASAKKDDRRIIGVMTGLSSNKERSEEADKMMSWAFREYDNYTLVKKGDKLADIPVWYGTDKTVPLVANEDIIKTLKKSQYNQAKVTIIYDKPVKAPIEMGQQLGTLKVEIPNMATEELPLVAGQTINKLGLRGKFLANIKYLMSGEM